MSEPLMARNTPAKAMSDRKDRMVKCVLDLAAYKYDPAIMRMTLTEAGAFFRLLLALWWMPEPGIVGVDEQLLQRLCETTPEEWTLVRPALARAFDTESRPGFWIDPRMVASHEHQTRWRDRQSAYGKAGAKAKAERNPKSASREPKGSLEGHLSGSGSGSAPLRSGPDEKKKTRSRASCSFVRPTLEEVRNYCIERKNVVDPDAFLAHYESNGWLVGKNPMKSWRAAIVTWEQRAKSDGRASPRRIETGNYSKLDEMRGWREAWEKESDKAARAAWDGDVE